MHIATDNAPVPGRAAGGDSVDFAWEHDEVLPFAQAFASLADDAVGRVKDDPSVVACFSPVAMDRLRFNLLERLAHIAAEPLLAIYGGERDQAYRSFVQDELNGGLARLTAQYPVAVRLATVVTDQWVDSVLELASRAESDRELLAERLSWGGGTPLVAEVSRPLGDHHNGGRHVLRLTDDQNRRIVYKPRPMAQEAAYGRMLDWANRQPVGHQLLVPAVIDQGAYGWMENVEAEACVDAEAHSRYSHRAGTHLSLLHMLGATDLHVENVIAAGEQPAMVDLECLVQPRLHDALRPQKGFAGDILADSVLFTGLLPGALPERGVLVVDLSGFGGQASQVTGTQIPAWRGLGTNDIRLGRTIAQTPPSTNQPTAGSVVDIDALIDGYEEMDAILASGDAPVAEFEKLTTRVVLRATPRYAAFMRAALRPLALRDETAFDAEIDVLDEWASELEDLTDDSSEVAWGREVVEIEQQALRQLDVPWFLAEAKSRGLRTADGDVVEDVFVGSGSEGLARRTVSIDPQATRLQTDLIRIAMEGSRMSTFVAPPSGAPDRPQPTDLVDRAVEIGEDVARRALRGPTGEASWLDVAPKGNTALWGPTLDASGLYMGSAGVALFLGALAKVTDSVEHLDLAVAALGDATAVADDDPGVLATWEMSSGLSGSAYVSATVGHLTDQPGLIGAAAATLRHALPPELLPHESLDVIGGWSGVALAAVAVGERAGDEGVLEVARRLAHLIVDSIDERNSDQWPKGFRRLGFAHGGTGIAYTVARVGHCLADARLLEIAHELVVAENTKAARRELPARIRPDSLGADVERGWCWGTSGFALARSRLEPLIGSDANVHADLAKAHAISGREGNHRLCCGVAGQVDMLVDGSPDPTELDPLIAALMVTDAELVLEPTLSFRGPSLFRGMSGVGYTLLRASDPTLPSVLAMD